VTRRQALLATGAALGGGCALTPAEDPALAAAVDTLMRPLVAGQRFSGALVLRRDGHERVARGWGQADREAGRPFTPDTPCDGASLAKNFTATGIALLVHEGRLSPQQPVQALVPAYPHAGVTVDHLLTHSGGLAPDYGSFDRHFAPGAVRRTDALLRLAARDTPAPAFEPGSRFGYSDIGYDALARVIERVLAGPGGRPEGALEEGAEGQAYAGFVRQRFFEPHGLRTAFARPARFADWPVPRTRGYRFEAGRWLDDDAHDGEAFLGASNLVFSARDLARWGDAWLHARVLPAAAEAAASVAPRPGGQASAINRLGWFGDHDRGPATREGHNTGNYNGFRACVHWDRAARTVLAYVSNSALPQARGDALQRALRALLEGRAVPPADAQLLHP
jgi:CubicO group peptidase (beta-lactamase class C family)